MNTFRKVFAKVVITSRFTVVSGNIRGFTTVSRNQFFLRSVNAQTQLNQTFVKFCNMPEKKAFQRLSKDIVPSNYNLRLKPNLSAFTFEGQEEISIEVCLN